MTIKAKLIGVFALGILTICALVFIFQYNSNRVLETRKWVEHTQTVLERLESTISLLKDIETAQRGYCLTGNVAFLEPYNRAVSKIPAISEQLRALTGDNPNQQKRLEELEGLESKKIEFVNRAIEIKKSGDDKATSDFVASLKGKQIMDQIRDLILKMESEEKFLLKARTEDAEKAAELSSLLCYLGALAAILVKLAGAVIILNLLTRSFRKLQESLDEIGAGNLNHRVDTSSNDEFSKLGSSFNSMANKLQLSMLESEKQVWLNSSLARLGQILQGERNLQLAGQKILSEFASNVQSRHGMFYILEKNGGKERLKLLASYAHSDRKNLSNVFEFGEGLVGQCALEGNRIILANAPDDYIKISSGTGEAMPSQIAVFPVAYDEEVKLVIEQATFSPFDEIQLKYLDQACQNLGIIFKNIESAHHTELLLKQEQTLSEELKNKQAELEENNQTLEELASSLQSSEEELRQQQEELQQTNEELEERSRIQAAQNEELEVKNTELEQLRLSIEEKAKQLSVTSRYKSEFLSNMSHELRTPLNSLLILSRILAENLEGNLSEDQVEYAKTIHSAGAELLILIDDVLDISKIEAGAMSIDIEDESLQALCDALRANFIALTKEKGLGFSIEVDENIPRFIQTDGRRLSQVLKNLIANAVKFTATGSVKMKIEQASEGWTRNNETLNDANSVLAFRIIDTGIGIPHDKQQIIFEAFRQADGNTNRKYGGTGLGLAISREIVRLLGGEIRLDSKSGEGSTFTVFLPVKYSGPVFGQEPASSYSETATSNVDALNSSETETTIDQNLLIDDRSQIHSGDKTLLVVQPDSLFSEQLINMSRKSGFKIVRALSGKEAFALVQRYRPDAIILDAGMPDKDGWIFLDRIKRDSNTRHIPVHVISSDDITEKARRLGAVGYFDRKASPEEISLILEKLNRFVSVKERKLLIVEDNKEERQSIESLLGGNDIKIVSVPSGEEAWSKIKEEKFDCLVLDLGLPGMSGFELLKKIHSESDFQDIPVVIHTSRELTTEEESELRKSAGTIVVKGNRSEERLLDETMLFLHRIESSLPENKRKMLERLHLKDPLLSGRRVLIADDDMRHIFAITSILERYDIEVSYAENGKQALDILNKEDRFDLLLMDVMMPEMDGFEAMKAIRKFDKYKTIPIIALTAKAMKGDKEQCVQAGASDYLSKPVDTDQLLSLMRVWLY